ncbi:6-hydroxymethylpterin diphosphokinase MptE-like protein [Pseudoalteromonas xiamenensis]
MNEINLIEQIHQLDEKLASSVEHKKREAKFAEEANIRFENNMSAFSKYFPDIAKLLSTYQVRDDFCLHVTPSGHGNFLPKGCSAPLYGDDPIVQSKKQVESQTLHPFFSLTDYTGYNSDDSDKRVHTRYMTALSSVMRKIESDNSERIKSLPSHFPSGIIFGIGLGYHIPLLLERTTFDYLFIVEPDIEQFFASLFCIDWCDLIQSIDGQGGCLFFNLGADKRSFVKDLENIAEDIGAFSLVRSFCYQHTPQAEINELITKWCNDFFLFQYGHGFFNDALTGLAHSIHLVEKSAQFLGWNKNSNIDFDTPIFIIGNGPSLDEAEEFIRQHHEQAIVVAAGTAVATLYRKGIPTDFHVLVERPYSNYKIFGDIVPAEVYREINLLGLNTLYPDNVDRYKWAGIATKGNEAGTFLLDLIAYQQTGRILPLIPYSNPVVANTALSFALYLGFKNIYLFGVDNGNLPCGSHHSKDSIYKKIKKIKMSKATVVWLWMKKLYQVIWGGCYDK